MYLGIFSINDTIYLRVNTVNKQGSAQDTTAGPIFAIYKNDSSTALTTGTMTKVGTKTGHYEGNFIATNFTVGQHFVLIEATVAGQTPSTTLAFQIVKDSQSISETFQDIETIAASLPSIGDGTVSVDHNFGKTDALRILTSSGAPISEVAIRAFVKTDFDAGRKSNQYVVGQSKSKTDGRWQQAIRLDPGTYTIQFTKGAFLSNSTDITVT